MSGTVLGGRFGYFFYFFFCFGGRRKAGRSPTPNGGVLLFKNERGGRVSEEVRQGGAHRGWEGVAGRGGANFFFFSGPKCPLTLSFLFLGLFENTKENL